MSDVVLNFISLHPGVPGYCVYMDKVCPGVSGSRLLQPGSRYTGTSRSPYKRNRENNSKLSTSRGPGTPGSYKPALCYTVVKLEYDYIIIISRTFNIIMSLIVENPY